MLNIQKNIVISQRGKFKFFAMITNNKRKKELEKKGYSKEYLNSIRALNSFMHTLSKKEYNELKYGGARLINFVSI